METKYYEGQNDNLQTSSTEWNRAKLDAALVDLGDGKKGLYSSKGPDSMRTYLEVRKIPIVDEFLDQNMRNKYYDLLNEALRENPDKKYADMTAEPAEDREGTIFKASAEYFGNKDDMQCEILFSNLDELSVSVMSELRNDYVKRYEATAAYKSNNATLGDGKVATEEEKKTFSDAVQSKYNLPRRSHENVREDAAMGMSTGDDYQKGFGE